MDVSTALLGALTQLAKSVDLDAGLLRTPLRALVGELHAAVGSYRGLQLTIVRNGQPVILTDVWTRTRMDPSSRPFEFR